MTSWRVQKTHEEHNVTPLTLSLMMNTWTSKLLKKLLDGHDVATHHTCLEADNGMEMFTNHALWEKASSHILNKIKTKPAFAEFIYKKSNFVGTKLLKLIRSTTKATVEEWSNIKIADFLSKSYDLAIEFCSYGYVPVISDMLFFKFSSSLKAAVKAAAELEGTEVSVPEITQLLSTPIKRIPSKLARLELLSILLKFKRVKKLPRQELLKYYNKWYWVDFGHVGPTPDFNDFFINAVKLFKQIKKVESEFEELSAELKKISLRQKQLVRKLGLKRDEQALFSVARTFMYLKGFRMEVLFGMYAEWSRVLTVVSKRLKVSKEILYYCSIDEIITWLKSGVRVRSDILEERKKLCVWLPLDERRQNILIGKVATKYIREHTEAQSVGDQNLTVIHGTVASLGYAKGVVRVVNKVSEIDKVKNGDILVSTATHPGLLPAMQRAAAFITDTGGITSHAAIVARELKKPCIIGTRIATKVLKDGDVVEIDTRKGDIRKI